jgi:hypothetical protein
MSAFWPPAAALERLQSSRNPTQQTSRQKRLPQSPPFCVAQKILSYTEAFCFMGLMKSALALPAIIVTSQPCLTSEKYVDSVSTS